MILIISILLILLALYHMTLGYQASSTFIKWSIVSSFIFTYIIYDHNLYTILTHTKYKFFNDLHYENNKQIISIDNNDLTSNNQVYKININNHPIFIDKNTSIQIIQDNNQSSFLLTTICKPSYSFDYYFGYWKIKEKCPYSIKKTLFLNKNITLN